MALVMAAITPHGWPLLPELSADAEGAAATRAAMAEMGRRARAAGVEAVVVATPHWLRVDGAVCLADAARGFGILHYKGRHVEINCAIDGSLTDAIAAEARARDVPVALAGYGGNRRDQSGMPVDWGALIPLWFLGHDRNLAGSGDILAPDPEPDGAPPVVIVAPSRSLPRERLVAFGRAVGAAADSDPRRILFVASCDWGHRHAESGPYGFHPEAAAVDAEVVAAVRENRVGSLIDLPEERARDAAIDGLWQALMLAGAVEGRGWASDLLTYEAPTYYGMLVATWGGAAVSG